MFRRKAHQEPSKPLAPVDYPSDLFVATEKGVYLIKGGYKYRLFSDKVLRSWKAPVVIGSEAALGNHTEGPVLGFRNGTLVKVFSDPKIYIISENKRRHVADFERYGLSRDNVMLVSRDEINLHQEGEVLS